MLYFGKLQRLEFATVTFRTAFCIGSRHTAIKSSLHLAKILQYHSLNIFVSVQTNSAAGKQFLLFEMTGVVNLTLCCFLLFVNPWRASSIQIFAKLLKEDHVLNLEHFGTSAVSSPLQCLYRCHRKRGCHGMNIGRDESGSLICQLTASQARDDEDENAGLLEEKHGWDCYSVFDPNRHWMEIKVGVCFNIMHCTE